MNEKIEKHLERLERKRHRLGLLRETALLQFRRIPNVRRIIQYVADALLKEAGEHPPDAELLGESVGRAKVRAAGEELRHILEFLGKAADPVRFLNLRAGEQPGPADRLLCKWVEGQRREVMRLVVRFERRVGPAPEVGAVLPSPFAPSGKAPGVRANAAKPRPTATGP